MVQNQTTPTRNGFRAGTGRYRKQLTQKAVEHKAISCTSNRAKCCGLCELFGRSSLCGVAGYEVISLRLIE